MSPSGHMTLPRIPKDQPILIAGPTASGKSELALRFAEEQGGVIVNADASQVFDCWRVITARPSAQDLARARHALYGHLPWNAPYSVGHWLREVEPLLRAPERPIIIGGTGLYFTALTKGLSDIPATPPAIRAQGDALDLETLIAGTHPDTLNRLDIANRARVQRAWEVEQATGQPLHVWQSNRPAPLLPEAQAATFCVQAPPDWLTPRIERRFDLMLEQGALDEVRAMAPRYDPDRPAFRAIGVPELMDHLTGEITLQEARNRAMIATRQFAKRQRTWFRSKMSAWSPINANS